jgi:hypothetical protein
MKYAVPSRLGRLKSERASMRANLADFFYANSKPIKRRRKVWSSHAREQVAAGRFQRMKEVVAAV